MNLRTMMKRLAAAGLAALATACSTGANFPAAKARDFVLGVTTKQDVIETFGKPQKEEVQTQRKDIGGKDLASSMVLSSFYYDYTEPPGAHAVGSSRPWRRAFLYFRDDKLVGYFQTSNFTADATKFNVDQVGSLQKGKTTEKDVLAVLGQPSGRGMYPLALDERGRALFYNFSVPERGSVVSQQARVFLSADGVVQDFSVTADSKAIPVAPTPVVIPIYIPRGR